MRVGDPAKVRSAINVTPLVDVVLVLLIIFMVMAPQLASGPPVELPKTDQPEDAAEDTRQIRVTLEHDGGVWVDEDPLTRDQLPGFLSAVAEEKGDWKIILHGDARLTFGEVKQTMLLIESVGFKDVGLVAKKRETSGGRS